MRRPSGTWGRWPLFFSIGATVLMLGPFGGRAAGPHPLADGAVVGRGTIDAWRPGTSRDSPLDRPRDLTGRSVKTPRVRAVHTTDPALAGGSAYLLGVDPWLGYQRGRELALREFGQFDGVYGEAGRQAGPSLEDAATRMTVRDRACSCASCHNTPWRTMGAGQTIAKNGGRGRNTPHLFGAGLIEMLGWQNRLKLLELADTNRDGWISFHEAAGRKAYLDTLGTGRQGNQRILLGRFDDVDHDGLPDLDPSIAIWFVDAHGKRSPKARSLDDPDVAGYGIESQPFGHGQHMWQLLHGPPFPSTLRAAAAFFFDLHCGLQAFDPTILDEVELTGLSGTSAAGAVQFVSAAPRDRGCVRDSAGVSLDDPDRDGYAEEISEGDLDLIEWFLLNHPRPAEKLTTEPSRHGKELFTRIGCTGCHVPDWYLHAADPGAKDYTHRYPGDRRLFDLFVTPRPTEKSETLVGRLAMLADRKAGIFVPRRGEFTVAGLYSDLAGHDLGAGFQEVQYDGSIVRYHRTPPLWGVGSTAPYGHDGACLDLDSVIRRHGGEAVAPAARYGALPPAEREALLSFLRSLVLFGTDDLPCDVDGDGKIDEHFVVAGVDTGVERFEPEWLFKVPGKIEGPVTVTDGKQISRITSFALINCDEAYGTTLPYLLDTDGDGFPDKRDAQPKVRGYMPREAAAVR